MDIWIPNRQKHPLEDDYSNAESQSKPHGAIFVDGKEVADTLMCPHCGGHFVPRKGQLRLRCLKHDAKVCDNPICNTFCTDYYDTVGHSSGREI